MGDGTDRDDCKVEGGSRAAVGTIMKWSAVGRGVRLEVDWPDYLHKPLDPYLVWADLSGFKSVAAARAGHSGNKEPTLRLALELDSRADPFVAGLDVRNIVARGDSRFVTASVPLGKVRKLLKSDAVRRLEVGFIGPTPSSTTGPPPEVIAEPVVAVIDFGCAFAHERFRTLRGRRWQTRIAYLWDQSRPPDAASSNAGWRAVGDFGYGRELTGKAIDALIAGNTVGERVDEDAIYLSADHDSAATLLTHGNHVLDLAAGASPQVDPAACPKIIFVQLPAYAVDDTSGGSMVTHVLDALRYIVDRTHPLAPLVVNLSYGSMAGPHDGSTILESAMDALIESAMGPLPSDDPARYLSIVLPAGNNFESDGHAVLKLTLEQPARTLEWHVLADDPTDTFLELWYPRDAAGHVVIEVQPPVGPARPVAVGELAQLVAKGSTEPVCAVLHLKQASSGRDDAMVLIAMAPTSSRDPTRALAPSGIWRITASLVGKRTAVDVNAWVERDDPVIGTGAPPRQSRLLTGALPLAINEPSAFESQVQRAATCSSIANGSRTVIAGACLADTPAIELSRYSSAGKTRNQVRAHWPDLMATADTSRTLAGMPAAGTRAGTSVRMNGTSVAAPQVARALIEAFLPYRPPAPNAGGPSRPTPPRYDLGAVVECASPADDATRTGRGRLRLHP